MASTLNSNEDPDKSRLVEKIKYINVAEYIRLGY